MSENRFKKGIFYVFIANMLNLLVSLFSSFILPKFLSIETYANIKLFQLYITYIGILHLGYADGMYLRLGGKKVENLNKKEVKEEFKTFKIFQFFITIIAIAVSILLKQEILVYCALVIFPINISNYIRNLYNATGLFKKYSRFTNINTMLLFIINLILLLIIKTDYYKAYLIAYVMVYFGYWLFIEYENRKLWGEEKTHRSFKYLVEDIKMGFLLMIGNFCNVIFTTIDRVFVQNIFGTIKFAFYSFAVSVENLMTVFITPISTVMYNYFCNNKETKQIIKVKKEILIFSATIITVIFPAKFIVDNWLTKYTDSLSVLFLLFSAQYISIMIRCVHINLYKAQKKQNRYFFIMVTMVILSILSNFIAYLLFNNMTSIAVATLITNIVWFIIGEFDFKAYKLSKKDYLYIFCVMVVFLASGYISNAIIGLLIYVGITLVLSYTFEKDCLFETINIVVNFIRNKIIKRGSMEE